MFESIENVLIQLEESGKMNINKLLIRNSDGKKSVTMTAFVLGFVIVNLKLILSGTTIGGLSIAAFTGVEYAAALTALGAIYVLRRSGISKEDSK